MRWESRIWAQLFFHSKEVCRLTYRLLPIFSVSPSCGYFLEASRAAVVFRFFLPVGFMQSTPNPTQKNGWVVRFMQSGQSGSSVVGE